MTKAIRLADGMLLPVYQYVKIVKFAKANPQAVFPRSFNSDWISATGVEIYRQFHNELQNVINRRGGLIVQDCKIDKPKYIERRRLAARCRNCGGTIPKERFFVNHSHRFCSNDCQRNY